MHDKNVPIPWIIVNFVTNTEVLWNDGYKCEFAPSNVTVGVSKGMETKAPDVVEFLSHYKTSNACLHSV